MIQQSRFYNLVSRSFTSTNVTQLYYDYNAIATATNSSNDEKKSIQKSATIPQQQQKQQQQQQATSKDNDSQHWFRVDSNHKVKSQSKTKPTNAISMSTNPGCGV